jgi:23S rRNA pseudouridine2605 synthase
MNRPTTRRAPPAQARLRVPQSVAPASGEYSSPTVRLQKYLAEAGIASRRASESVILAGRVSVNGRVVQVLGTKIHPGEDRVEVDGRPIKPKRKLYIALHKPPGYISTRIDPLQRRLLTDLLPKEWGHLASVGRLDVESEGLIFLTNDGAFALHLTHPRYGVRKVYRATVEGRVEPAMLRRFLAGVEDAGEVLKVDKARLISANQSHSVVELELAEGRNREVRRLFLSQDLVVTRLQRIQIGRIKLGELPPGKWRTLTEPEIKSLLAPL